MILTPRYYHVGAKGLNARVTEQCGMLTATFMVGKGGPSIRPYSRAPWVGKEDISDKGYPALLEYLQGDFDCLPFGGNSTMVSGIQYPPHGETANLNWDESDSTSGKKGNALTLNLKTKLVSGEIEKVVALRNDEDVIYTRTKNKVKAELPYGHHAILRIPEVEGMYDISTSDFVYASTLPDDFREGGGHPRLVIGKEFKSLDKLPLRDGNTVSLNDYYATREHEDLAMVCHNPNEKFAWTALTNLQEGYVWFSLKDPGILNSTIFWLSHHGRDEQPWAGSDGKARHGHVIGIEDVSSLYHFGAAESLGQGTKGQEALEQLRAKGIRTTLHFDGTGKPSINYIQGVARIPDGFTGVRDIVRAEGTDLVTLIDKGGGAPVDVEVDWKWLHHGNLETLLN